MADKNINTVMKRAITKNPVLFEAIGIAPVVAMATSLKTAIMLTSITVVQMLITELIACRFLKMLKSRFRVLVYAVLGVLINIPMFSMFEYFAPNETANVSIFLPIIAVNSLIALHCERFAIRHKLKDTLLDAVSASFGYGLIVMLTGLIREIIGSGTVYGHSLGFEIKFSGLLLPFGGFLVLGYISALFKRIIKNFYPDEHPEAAFNLSEISQSHFGRIKNLFSEDFNPFDEDSDAETEIISSFKALYKPKSEYNTSPEQKKSSAKKSKNIKKHKKFTKTSKTDKPEIIIENHTEISGQAESTAPMQENILSDSKKYKYESEFDDLLLELENHKSKVSDENKKDGDTE